MSRSLQCPGTEGSGRPPEGLGSAGLTAEGKCTDMWYTWNSFLKTQICSTCYTGNRSKLTIDEKSQQSEKVKVLMAEVISHESALLSPACPCSFLTACGIPVWGLGRGEKFRLNPEVLRELRRKCHLSLAVKARSSICGVHTPVWLTFSENFFISCCPLR